MTTRVLAAALAGFVMFAASSTRGAAAADDKSALQDLLGENKNLSVQLDKAEAVKGDIAKAELSISGAQGALKTFQEKLKHDLAGLLEEGGRIDREDQQSGCRWGTRSKDEAYVASCNTEGRRLTELTNGLKSKALTVQQVAEKLDQEQATLNQRTMTLFKKKKSNNADLEDLYAAKADFLRRFQAFISRSETFERLKKQEPIESKVCTKLSLPEASECLKRLWDGAR